MLIDGIDSSIFHLLDPHWVQSCDQTKAYRQLVDMVRVIWFSHVIRLSRIDKVVDMI